MTYVSHYANVVDHLATALGRTAAWLAHLDAASVITDRGGALPASVASPSGHYVVLWTGATDAVNVALAGGNGGSVQTALDRYDGTAWVLVTDCDGVGSLDVTAGTSPPAAVAIYAATDGQARRYLIDAGGKAEIPSLLIGQPAVQATSESRDHYDVRAILDWLIMIDGDESTHGEDLLAAGELAGRMLEELVAQHEAWHVLDWEPTDWETRECVRLDPFSDREGVITVPSAIALECSTL